MNYITLEQIKSHCRIDSDLEDEYLEVLGAGAEEAVLAILNRTLDDLKEANGGDVPQMVVIATLMLVEQHYKERGVVSAGNLSAIPYNFDFMVKPWMVL